MLELVGCVFGLLYVITAGLQWRSSWYFGLLSVLVYIYIFYDTQLYSDLILQLFYAIATVYGIYMWQQKDLRQTGMDVRQHLMFLCEGFLWSLVLFQVNIHLPQWNPRWFQTPSYPLVDSLISGFSIGATRLIAHKKTPVWLWWILIDLSGAGLYVFKELWMTAFLSLAYAGFALWNYIQWKKLASPENIVF